MKNNCLNLSKIINFAFVLIMLVGICITPAVVSAEETAAVSTEVQKVVDLISKLPTDTETVTIDNKADIVEAKLAYDALTPEQKIEVSTDYLVILNGNYNAVMPFMLSNLVESMKEYPEADKIPESEKDNIVTLYIDYQLLDDTAKEAFSQQHKQKLIGAVERLAPDELTEEDAEVIAQIREEEEAKEKAEAEKKEKQRKNIEKIFWYALIIFVSIIVLGSLVAVIILIIKLIRLSR